MPNEISQQDIDSYSQNGFLVVPDVLTAEELKELNAETVAICRGSGAVKGVTPAGPQETDADVLSRYLCIHFPHKVSPLMLKYLKHPRIVDGLTKLIGPNVKSMQSMLFIKAAGKPGQAWHQDEYYISTRDRSLTAAWIAQDDATLENGCLWVIPGSHKQGIIWPTHAHNDPRFDFAEEAIHFPYKEEDAVPVIVKAGTVLYFSGYLLHRSLPNRTKEGLRRALVNHYMSAESLLPWLNPKEGARGPHDMRDIVMVAGTDPYAWKGIDNLTEPHIRSFK